MSTRLLIVTVLLAVGCGPEAPPVAVPLSVDAGFEPTPTDKQKLALANPLHRAHMDAKDEPTECRDCHRIEGRTQPTRAVKHRCLGCHEDQTSAVHAKVSNADARECLTCHEFFAADVDPWACGDCHRAGGAPPADGAHADGRARRSIVSALQNNAGSVAVHEQDCKACHAPHGERALAPKPCVDCHEDTSARHASVDDRGTALDDPDQCLECHMGHQPASTARNTCDRCHRDVPKTARFTGHDECVSCHQPHSGSGKKPCRSCHTDQLTVGAARDESHQRCTNCHQSHLVRRPGGCEKCHDDKAPEVRASHPDDGQRGTCQGCHPQHPVDGALKTAANCTSCHDEAKSEVGFHQGTACRNCHQPHGFRLADEGAKLCRSCHVEADRTHPAKAAADVAARTAKTVAPVTGHGECAECHPKANHVLDKPQADCGRCHEEQKALVSVSHNKCSECHAPHEGVVQKDCAGCHKSKVGRGRHTPKLDDCDDCHSIHTGPPTKPPLCISCHEPPLPHLHQNQGHRTCQDCHGFHDQAPRKSRASCLKGCHEAQVDHEPKAEQCIGCHPFQQAPRKVRP